MNYIFFENLIKLSKFNKIIIIKTASFNILKNSEIEGGVSISLFPSNSSDIMFEYKALAPNFRLLDNFKRKKITEEKFVIGIQRDAF